MIINVFEKFKFCNFYCRKYDEEEGYLMVMMVLEVIVFFSVCVGGGEVLVIYGFGIVVFEIGNWVEYESEEEEEEEEML